MISINEHDPAGAHKTGHIGDVNQDAVEEVAAIHERGIERLTRRDQRGKDKGRVFLEEPEVVGHPRFADGAQAGVVSVGALKWVHGSVMHLPLRVALQRALKDVEG